MEAMRWPNEANEVFSHSELERKLSLISIHGNMRHRSAAEMWRWLALIVKKIHGFIKCLNCENVNIIPTWRPLPQSWRSARQRNKTRKEGGTNHNIHVDSDLSCEADASISSPNVISPRRGRGWVRRLIIRGTNGKRPGKRRIELDSEGRKGRLARKRRKIGRVGWVKQQRKETGEPDLRVFLRPEERHAPSQDSDHKLKKQSPTERSSEPAACSQSGRNSNEKMAEAGPSCTHTYDHPCYDRALPPDREADIQLLPDELVDKVLGRLPLTSVLRFRSVCRRWQSRLSHEGWYNIFPRNVPPAWTACPALFTSADGRRQCAFYDLSSRKWSCVFLDFLPGLACHFLAASGGLLCLCFSGMNSSLYICNPLTKSWRALPSFNHPRRRAGLMIVHMLVHPETGAYKVILIGHPKECVTAEPPATTEVFDSETGSWTVLATVPSVGCTLAPSVVLRNGVIYCLTEVPTGLLAFNLARKVWRRLEIKNHFRVLFLFQHLSHILLVARMCARVTRLGIWQLRETVPRVWLKVAIMPAEYANYFLKSGKLQCFGHGDFVCFASPRRPQWLLFDLAKRVWTWGSPARGLDEDNYNRWFFYEPRLDIQA